MGFHERLMRLIDKSDLISIDIFDTALSRLVNHPDDVWRYIEKTYSLPGFAKMRKMAAYKAWKIKGDDPSLDEIYSLISDCGWVKNIEIEAEFKLCRPNLEILSLYRYATKCGKRIIFLSDMYLSSSVLDSLLRKCGYDEDHAVFVSGELGVSKSKGGLYDLLKDKVGSNTKIVHIGDNESSDFRMARRHGIRAVLYKPDILDDKKISFLNNISEGASSLSWSILAGILKNKRRQFIFESEKAGLSEADYFRWVGYAYSAPLALCFAAYIEKIASKEKVRQILCVARDGFFLKKALDFFKRYCGARDFESSYLYASRAVCKSLLEDDERARLDYIKYLSRNKVDLNVPSIVVDTGTLNFSAQRALQKVFNSEILGVYFNVFAEADIDRANALKFFDFSAGLNRNIYPWDFLEFLISSPELPVESLDSGGNPVYKSNPDAAEIQRSKWIGEMNKGFEDFFHDCKDLCLMVSPSPVDIVKWINDLSFNPDNFDWQFLSKLKHTGNSQHQDYIPLFWCGKWKAWESLGAYRKRIKRSPWKTNIQRFIWKPILFELRSNGFSLVLNPRSTTVFCRLSFCLFGFNVKIAIGGVS